jgi:hypothetical protein
MKVFKMNKLEILESQINNKISFIQENILKSKQIDNEIVNKIPDYLDVISRLEKENSNLKADREFLKKEHNEDLLKVEDLVVKLSQLLENSDA